jgi:hypothetical protein
LGSTICSGEYLQRHAAPLPCRGLQLPVAQSQ